MERIKREILQAVTTGVTACTGTSKCYVIIPDTGVTYNFMVGLTQDTRDVGFLDAYVTGSTDGGGTGGGGEPENLSIFSVTTGTAEQTTKWYYFSGHEATDDGISGSTITEYGSLFTQNSDFGNQNDLVCENKGEPTVKSVSFTIPVELKTGETKTFGGKFFPDFDDATVYYRAYAINENGTFYGLVKSKLLTPLTGPPLIPPDEDPPELPEVPDEPTEPTGGGNGDERISFERPALE